MFLERKILERIHGEKFFHFDAILGWKHLQDDIDLFGSNNPLTKLVPDLTGIDPDDVRIASISGVFLSYLLFFKNLIVTMFTGLLVCAL